MKKRIENLISKDYLVRDEKDNNIFNYVAWILNKNYFIFLKNKL